jgi:hypothetical protein
VTAAQPLAAYTGKVTWLGTRDSNTVIGYMSVRMPRAGECSTGRTPD